MRGGAWAREAQAVPRAAAFCGGLGGMMLIAGVREAREKTRSGWGERRGFKLRQEVEILLMAFAHLSTFPQAASGAVRYKRFCATACWPSSHVLPRLPHKALGLRLSPRHSRAPGRRFLYYRPLLCSCHILRRHSLHRRLR